MTEVLHHLMRELIEYSIILLELIGVLVLLAGALRATVNYIKGDPHTRVKLCRAMAMALEFKLGGESCGQLSYVSFLKSHWLAASLF